MSHINTYWSCRSIHVIVNLIVNFIGTVTLRCYTLLLHVVICLDDTLFYLRELTPPIENNYNTARCALLLFHSVCERNNTRSSFSTTLLVIFQEMKM